jgi:hypothetical protein
MQSGESASLVFQVTLILLLFLLGTWLTARGQVRNASWYFHARLGMCTWQRVLQQ